MKLKTWLPIALALVLGVAAAKLAHDALASRKNAAGATATGVRIVVARRAVAPGTALGVEEVEIRPIAAETAPEGAHAQLAEVVGRAAQVQLVKGQPVLDSHLAAHGAASGLQALVPSGMRAMTIEVNEFSSVAGMIVPGSRVDILSTMQEPRSNETMSRTIAQNVLIKAVGQSTGTVEQTDEAPKPANSVTLLVTLKQAEAIQLCVATGRPWLVLRGSADQAVDARSGTTLAELRGATPSLAQQFLAALKPGMGKATPHTTPTVTPTPTTQPAPSSWAVTRMVHTIRGTVESMVSIAATTTSAPAATENNDASAAMTGTTIEP